MPYLTIKARLRGAPERFAILRDAMLSATKVYNGLIFHLREEYEQHGKVCYWDGLLGRSFKSTSATRRHGLPDSGRRHVSLRCAIPTLTMDPSR